MPTGAVGIFSAQKAFAEKTVAIELLPISSKSSLDDLEAPSESTSDSNRAVKEIERLKKEEVCHAFPHGA
jgi:hypothetical protein